MIFLMYVHNSKRLFLSGQPELGSSETTYIKKTEGVIHYFCDKKNQWLRRHNYSRRHGAVCNHHLGI